MKFTLLITEDFVQYQIYSEINRNVCEQTFDIKWTQLWLWSSSWLAIIFMKWKVSCAMDGCRRSSLKDFDSHEAHW